MLITTIVFASCHGNNQTVITPEASTEDNRKAVKGVPPGQNNIPEIKKAFQCDTFKVKGGQDQIIAFQPSQQIIDKIEDNKERLKVVRQANDFQLYFLSITKEFSGTGISLNSTFACYINIFDDVYATEKERTGLILIKANGTQKVIPGVHSFDEWKDEVRNFFNK